MLRKDLCNDVGRIDVVNDFCVAICICVLKEDK